MLERILTISPRTAHLYYYGDYYLEKNIILCKYLNDGYIHRPLVKTVTDRLIYYSNLKEVLKDLKISHPYHEIITDSKEINKYLMILEMQK